MSGTRLERRRRRLVLRYWGTFVALLVALQAAVLAAGPRLWDADTAWTAWITAGALRLLGLTVQLEGPLIRGDGFALTIIRECTATLPASILVAAVIAFPCRWRARLIGLALGLPAVVAVNVVRLVSLAWLLRVRPELFSTVHLLVWQSLIVFFTLLIWLVWAGTLGSRDALGSA